MKISLMVVLAIVFAFAGFVLAPIMGFTPFTDFWAWSYSYFFFALAIVAVIVEIIEKKCKKKK